MYLIEELETILWWDVHRNSPFTATCVPSYQESIYLCFNLIVYFNVPVIELSGLG